MQRVPLHVSIATLSALTALLSATAICQRHIYTFHGEAAGGLFGFAVKAAGDTNRDGFADVIVGSWGEGKNGPLSGTARVYSGLDGRVLHMVHGERAGANFGFSVAGAGDVDRDGCDDFIVGAVNDPKKALQAGSASVYSGRTGKMLHTWTGDGGKDLFGNRVAGAGDVDKDGIPDLIVGAPCGKNRQGIRTGYARVFSGKNGATLFTLCGTHVDQLYGYAVMGVGDINGDGHADFMLGSPHDQTNGKDAGSVQVFSGKDATRIYTFYGVANDHAGRALDSAGDVDRDGRPDLIYGGEATIHKDIAGQARVISGRTGMLIHTFRGVPRVDEFAMSVGGVGDVNGDGHSDLIVGAPSGFDPNKRQTGYARLFSGKDGTLLATIHGSTPGSYFGYYVSGAGDVNRDGVPDLVIGAHLTSSQAPLAGLAQIVSGRRLPLTSDVHLVSVSSGGVQNMVLDADAAHASQVYLVLGTLSGTRPGSRFGSLTLPLNPDAYFTFTLGSPNTLIAGSLGTLDSNGRAAASFRLPPGLPASLAGTLLHHAFLAVNAVPLRFDLASNAVPLTLGK